MNDDSKSIKDQSIILSMAKRIVNKTLRSVLPTSVDGGSDEHTTRTSKGGFGTILEREYFGIQENFNESVPDFREAGIELKSSPVIKTAKGIKAKERMVLSIINYHSLKDEIFENSSFLKKNARLLVVFYLHEKDKPVKDLKVVLADLWSIPNEDLPVIKKDWEDIKEMVMAGKAHEIHEGMTRYLAACTKGKDSNSLRDQPFSEKKAMQRAFSFKQSYVNSIIQYLQKKENILQQDSIVKQGLPKGYDSFEEIVIERFNPYIGWDVVAIGKKFDFDVNSRAKNINDLLTRRILGVKKRIIEFEKADITLRSITVEANGKIKEHISFPAFRYDEIVKEDDWDTSQIREMFVKRFFFVIYQKDERGIKHLKKVMFWSIPPKDLEEVRKVWSDTKKCIIDGKYPELPKSTDNKVSHVRPHARTARDTITAPDGSKQVKRSFWLNRSYIEKQIGAVPWTLDNR
ncbi:MAG: DNA mismatch repair protein [Methanomassiliicoccales archaeon]|nr:MAG: DNA mismatch repair protein [Methanomassiliicoccales archaeon]